MRFLLASAKAPPRGGFRIVKPFCPTKQFILRKVVVMIFRQISREILVNVCKI